MKWPILVLVLAALPACEGTTADENLQAVAEKQSADVANDLGRAAEDAVERAGDIGDFAENQLSELEGGDATNRAHENSR